MKGNKTLLIIAFLSLFIFLILSLFSYSSFLMFIPIILPFGWFYKKKIIVKKKEEKKKVKWTW